ncbi:MAG TPA: hypothetical protein VGP76_00250 [Planctomycetaceae bacterium]|jgi:hypothetical protein|nr:hypothetical protein [Planctomycetaceae bacterium]
MCTATFTTRTLIERKSELRRSFESLVFAAAMLFVGAVSVYDGYLVVRTGDEIRHFEKNPVGLFLIEHNHGDPTVFLMAKAAGTLVVLAALTMLYQRSQRIAFSVASALILFQAGLLVFLERGGG